MNFLFPKIMSPINIFSPTNNLMQPFTGKYELNNPEDNDDQPKQIPS